VNNNILLLRSLGNCLGVLGYKHLVPTGLKELLVLFRYHAHSNTLTKIYPENRSFHNPLCTSLCAFVRLRSILFT
jgi:hypothetical protein